MTGNKKKTKISPRSKFSASPGPPLPAVLTVHASGESSSPTSTSESNLHADSSSPGPQTSASSPPVASPSVQPQSPETKKRGRNKNLSTNDAERPTSRWFLRTGTWPRSGSKKSAPVASVAQENPSGTSTSPTSSIRHGGAPNTPAVIPEEAQNSPVPAAAPSIMAKSAAPSTREASRAPSLHPEPVETESMGVPEDAKDAEDGNCKDGGNDAKSDDSAAAPATGSYWLGWWYGWPSPAAEASPAPKSESPEEQADEAPVVQVVITREPTPPPPPPPPPPPQEPEPEPVPTETSRVPTIDDVVGSKANPRPRSWFGFWGGGPDPAVPNPEESEESSNSTEPTEPSQESSPHVSQILTRSEPASAAELIAKQSDTHLLGAQTDPPAPLSPNPSVAGTASSAASVAPVRSGWAFWSRDRSRATGLPNDSDASSTTTVGQLAVAGTPSASNPQRAKVKVKDIPSAVPPPSPTTANEPKVARSVSNLREESRPITPRKSGANTSIAAVVPVTPQSAISTSSATAKQTLKKVMPTNHVLPEFESCYNTIRQPSILCQMTRVFRSQVPQSKKHLYLTPTPPRIKKAVAIGVHGFFPMRLVRTVLGEPTGTSIRFANSAAAAIKRWAEKNKVEVQIEKIALEGEGKVGDRVEMLWKLLSNWMDHVKNADFVLMAAHSQGVVVGVQLLARLIEEGCMKEKARVGFTAMAGINLGPFYHLPTTILTGSAKELFEFQKPDSAPSQKYMQALEVILKHNVRVLYVGSIDDQLVPLESSSFSNVTHPYIFRAVFVDGRVHAPDFLSHLVGFAMKLRNQGISDHGLIRELSSPLAGSLYGGEGHSRIYDDVQVYDLGVRHALETTGCEGVAMKVKPFELPTNANNPFFLPWSMRGMLEEPYVKDRLRDECMQLLEQFENWKPSSKVLKDVKFRLEGIRSKL